MTHTVRRVVVVTGVVVLAIGLRGIITDRFLTHPVNWALFFLGGALAHDLLLAPAVAVLARRVPASVRPPVLGGMVVSGLLTAVALPVVLGSANEPTTPRSSPSTTTATCSCCWRWYGRSWDSSYYTAS